MHFLLCTHLVQFGCFRRGELSNFRTFGEMLVSIQSNEISREMAPSGRTMKSSYLSPKSTDITVFRSKGIRFQKGFLFSYYLSHIFDCHTFTHLKTKQNGLSTMWLISWLNSMANELQTCNIRLQRLIIYT